MGLSRRAIPRARKLAQSLMNTKVRVSRIEKYGFDPDTLEPRSQRKELYLGLAKIQSYEAYESRIESAGSTRTSVRVRVDFPASSPAFIPGDIVDVLDCPTGPFLKDRQYRIASAAPFKSYASANRVFVDEVIEGDIRADY